VRYCGATPVFVDIEQGTYNMDPEWLESAITPRTRAILCVHQMGMPCQLAMILEIARRHSLPVVEDAACAAGSKIMFDGHWERIGRPHGDVACFSFHPRKLITTGEGGMITTANAEWDRQFRLWRQHGMDVPAATRHGAAKPAFESYPELGYNYRMTDIQAAVGREQLKRLPMLIEQRRLLAGRYRALLADERAIKVPYEPEWALSNFQSYCIRLPDGCDQREVMQLMLNQGIATRRGIMCIHRESSYADTPVPLPLVESEDARNRCILLPLYHELTADDQARVAKALGKACRRRLDVTRATMLKTRLNARPEPEPVLA